MNGPQRTTVRFPLVRQWRRPYRRLKCAGPPTTTGVEFEGTVRHDDARDGGPTATMDEQFYRLTQWRLIARVGFAARPRRARPGRSVARCAQPPRNTIERRLIGSFSDGVGTFEVTTLFTGKPIKVSLQHCRASPPTLRLVGSSHVPDAGKDLGDELGDGSRPRQMSGDLRCADKTESDAAATLCLVPLNRFTIVGNIQP